MKRTAVAVVVLLVAVSAVSPVVAAGGPEASAADAEVGDCSFPLTVTDGTDTEMTIEEEPESVVTLNPSAAQTMWEIGAEEKVTGVTKHAMNLDGADQRVNISREGDTINPEVVVDHDPDLVLAPDSQVVSEELIEVLREAGLTVYLFPSAESIDDIRDRTRTIGALVGECDGAEETIEWMDEEIAIAEAAADGQERPDALYVFFGFTAGAETHIHEIIEAGGATNVAAEVGIAEYEPVNDEMVVEQNPDWIILNTNSPEIPDGEAYESTTAVQEEQVVTIDINHLNRPAPRVVHAISELAQTFHPEAYEEARAEAESTPTETETPEATPTETPDETPDPDDQAGFAPIVAIASLLVAAVLANRRNDGAT